MTPLLLIGASGCGQEVAAMIRHMNARQGPEWEIVGFLDDDTGKRGELVDGHPVLGGVEAVAEHTGQGVRCVCCIADPLVKMEVVARAERYGARWATVAHPTAIVMDTARVGEGCLLLPYSAVTNCAQVGRHVLLNYHAAVGHDGVVGDYGTLSSFVDITGKVVLGQGVFVGSGVSVLPGCSIGEYAVIGGGALVHQDIPPGVVAVGVPAQVVKAREGLAIRG